MMVGRVESEVLGDECQRLWRELVDGWFGESDGLAVLAPFTFTCTSYTTKDDPVQDGAFKRVF